MSAMNVSDGIQPTYSWTFGRASAVNVRGVGNDETWAVTQLTTAGISAPLPHRFYPADLSFPYATVPGSVNVLTAGTTYVVIAVSTDNARAACASFRP